MHSPTLTPLPPKNAWSKKYWQKLMTANNNTKLFLRTSYLLLAVSLLRSLRLGKEPCVMTPSNGCQGN